MDSPLRLDRPLVSGFLIRIDRPKVITVLAVAMKMLPSLLLTILICLCAQAAIAQDLGDLTEQSSAITAQVPSRDPRAEAEAEGEAGISRRKTMSSGNLNIQDPEFDPMTFNVAWRTNDGRLFIAPVNPSTGDILLIKESKWTADSHVPARSSTAPSGP